MKTKKCTKCKETKSVLEFSTDNRRDDSYTCWCKRCNNKNRRENELHCQYGITVKQYELMLKSQNGVCAICNQSETAKDRGGDKVKALAIDHDHKINKIRGLLCHCCNLVLGHAKDNPEILRKAAEYLEKHK